MGVRTIRAPIGERVAAIAVAGTFALIIAVSFLDAFTSGRSVSGWPIGLAMICALAAFGYRVTRIGLYITPTEVIVRNIYYNRRLPRDAVEGFTVHLMATAALLRLHTVTGEVIPVEITRTSRLGNNNRLQLLHARCLSLNDVIHDRDDN